MAVREVQLLDSSVKSRTIAADTIVAADIASGGVGTAELADDAVTTAKISPTVFQGGTINATASNAGTVIEFPTNFTSIPTVVVSIYGSGTATMPTLRWDSASTASFKVYLSSDSTISWLAFVSP
ncbi:MAG: hypothetical protein J7K36_08960 [Archaeoglobaceae archaeon]|nr:hypothetical protein [Archaeoglobaceae archaeon]